MLTHVAYMSPETGTTYLFDITTEGPWIMASTDRKVGGLNTCAKSWNRLLGTMIPDCVATWEET